MVDPKPWPGEWGYPLHPEKNGWHILDHDNGTWGAYAWDAGQQSWWIVDRPVPPSSIRRGRYLGPCLPPAKVTEIIERGIGETLVLATEAGRLAGAEAMRDEAARLVERRAAALDGLVDWVESVVAAIRALPLTKHPAAPPPAPPPPAGADEPAAWQWRYRTIGKTVGKWTDWMDGRASRILGVNYEVEERPLYLRPAPAAPQDQRPATCRNRLRDEGKSYPRSGCSACWWGTRGCPHEKGPARAE